MLLLRNETINYFVSTYNLSPDTCHCKLIFTYRFLQNKFLISFYHKVFLSILTAFPPPPPLVTNHAVFICVNCKTTTVCKRNSLVMGGGKHSSKTFSIFYVLNSKNRVFSPYFSIGTCPMRKRLLWISRGLNLLSFSQKKYHFLWNFSLVTFMGNPSLRLSEVLCRRNSRET